MLAVEMEINLNLVTAVTFLCALKWSILLLLRWLCFSLPLLTHVILYMMGFILMGLISCVSGDFLVYICAKRRSRCVAL